MPINLLVHKMHSLPPWFIPQLLFVMATNIIWTWSLTRDDRFTMEWRVPKSGPRVWWYGGSEGGREGLADRPAAPWLRALLLELKLWWWFNLTEVTLQRHSDILPRIKTSVSTTFHKAWWSTRVVGWWQRKWDFSSLKNDVNRLIQHKIFRIVTQ